MLQMSLHYISGHEREAEVNVAQCVFTGPPRVGKSSFWKRLMGIIPEELIASTGITSEDGSVRLDIRGHCGFAVHISKLGWKKLQAEEELEAFVSLISHQDFSLSEIEMDISFATSDAEKPGV